MNKWDQRFFDLAKVVATWSKDPDCKVGAVLVSPDRRSFAIGYNGFAAGVADDERLFDKARKNQLTIHAEVNAILNARRDLANWTLYCTKAPCVSCANTIIQSGITSVVHPSADSDSRWHNENLDAIFLLNKAKIVSKSIRDNVLFDK